MGFILILTTCPNEEFAKNLAQRLVSKKLAACVNILSDVKSFYFWEHKMASEEEVVLLIKTIEENYGEVEDEIILDHPYQVPEVIAIPILKGSGKYLNWVKENSNLK